MITGIIGTLTALGIGIVLIVGIMILILPLVNKILTPETIEIINNMLDNLEYFIGNDNLTIFLCLITIIIIIGLIRFFTRFFHINNE